MNQQTAKALIGGAFGAIPGWLIGMELADLGAGVIEPIARAAKVAQATGHPGLGRVGTIWHHWVSHHGYWPTHWGSVLGHPDLLIGALGLGCLTGSLVAYQSTKSSGISLWGGPKAAGKGHYGTAHWRALKSLSESYTRWQTPVTQDHKAMLLKTVADIHTDADAIHDKWVKNGKKGPEPGLPKVGLLVGLDAISNPLAAWILERDEHALVLGSTGAGKTRRLILPTVGIIGSTATESMILTDPKAELYDHSAKWLESRGYDIIRIDLIEPAPGLSDQFNPIAPVWQALHQAVPDWARAADVARHVAHIITFGGSGSLASTDPLWINGQIALISAMCLGVADRTATEEECHLASAYRLLLTAGNDEGATLDRFFDSFSPGHPAALAFGTYRLAQGKTRASIITTAAAALQLWGDPRVAWVTAAQSHEIRAIAEHPTAVFLVVPDEDKSRHPVAALYINQLFITLTQLARKHGGHLPLRVTFLLDEFGNMPPFPDFDSTVTVARSRGMRLVLALQNLEQLHSKYDATERTIRGNLGTWLFLRTSDLQTAKELSEMIGRYTLNSESLQLPRVSWNTIDSGVAHTSQGLSLTGRELVTADELMRWPTDRVLVWQAGYPPAQMALPDLSVWKIFPDLQQRQPWSPPDEPVPEVPIYEFPAEEVWPANPKALQTPAPGVPEWQTQSGLTMAPAAVRDASRLDITTSSQRGEPAMIAASALGGMGDLFLSGQQAMIDPDDMPEDDQESDVAAHRVPV